MKDNSSFFSPVHEIDPWGYYCESWCKKCKECQRYCKTCETYYGEGQRHEGYECNKRLKELLDKQLSFPF